MYYSDIPKRDQDHGLMVQIARLLNESDVYICHFVAIGKELYGMIDNASQMYCEGGGYSYELFHPATFLECIHGC